MKWFDNVSNLANLHLLNLESHLIISRWENISRYIVGENDQMLSLLVASMGAVRNQGMMHIIFPGRILNYISRCGKSRGVLSVSCYCEQDKCPS